MADVNNPRPNNGENQQILVDDTYYLHHLDNLGAILVTQVLTGDN